MKKYLWIKAQEALILVIVGLFWTATFFFKRYELLKKMYYDLFRIEYNTKQDKFYEWYERKKD
jgi:hypothetical protein